MLERVVTQAEFAALVGITQQAVSDLASRGVLKPNTAGGGWLLAYCQHLREQAAGRAGELASASAALKRSQREEVELRLAIKRRQFAPVAVLQVVVARGARRAEAVLATIVPNVRRRWPDIKAEHLAVIEAEIVRARNEVAGVSIDAVLAEIDDEKAAA